MTAALIFPLAQWMEGTNQNSTPANDNALRILVAMGPAQGVASIEPTAPYDEYEQWIIGSDWGGFSSGNIIVWLGGSWKEFAYYDGQVKSIAGEPYVRSHGAWNLLRYIGDGHSGS